jgi:hypothetical protein
MRQYKRAVLLLVENILEDATKLYHVIMDISVCGNDVWKLCVRKIMFIFMELAGLYILLRLD